MVSSIFPVLLEIPMSSSIRQRDWMFSSLVSGGRPANSFFSVASVASNMLSMERVLYFTPRMRACSSASFKLISEV